MASRGFTRQYWVAVRFLLVATVVLGLAYPLLITGIGQVVANRQANGSLLIVDGEPVGSSLIGQSFADGSGAPLPEWFQSRPSAAGNGYDGAASSGSNLGPENPALVDAIDERAATIEDSDGVDRSQIPADALTASASGLDPHISPEYARLQIGRIADARGLNVADVEDLVEGAIRPADLGYLGNPTVNVLELNIALAELDQ